MILLESRDLFENDRSVFIKSTLYQGRDFEAIVKRSNPDFEKLFVKKLAQVSAQVFRRMWNQRNENYKRTRNIPHYSDIQFSLETAQKAIDSLSSCSRFDSYKEHMYHCRTAIGRLTPSVNSHFYSGYKQKLISIDSFLTQKSLERVQKVLLDIYRTEVQNTLF